MRKYGGSELWQFQFHNTLGLLFFVHLRTRLFFTFIIRPFHEFVGFSVKCVIWSVNYTVTVENVTTYIFSSFAFINLTVPVKQLTRIFSHELVLSSLQTHRDKSRSFLLILFSPILYEKKYYIVLNNKHHHFLHNVGRWKFW